MYIHTIYIQYIYTYNIYIHTLYIYIQYIYTYNIYIHTIYIYIQSTEALCLTLQGPKASKFLQALLLCDVRMLCCRTGSLLITAVEAALRIPQQLPTSKPLRARFISFLHRMVRMLPAFACAVNSCSIHCRHLRRFLIGRTLGFHLHVCACSDDQVPCSKNMHISCQVHASDEHCSRPSHSSSFPCAWLCQTHVLF